ncbi:MAG TPA: hypothetical protein VNF02_02330 [Candidatus Limnocylindrales bacterium]|nr:hypothetical protein [Candidatus Limnocylindrales bacterium]
MALAFTLVDSWDDGRRIHVAGTVAASGSYTTGGDTLDLSGIGALGVPTTKPPIQGTAWMDGLAGYDYVFSPGAAINANTVKMFQQASGAGAFLPRFPATRSRSTASFRGCSSRTLLFLGTSAGRALLASWRAGGILVTGQKGAVEC